MLEKAVEGIKDAVSGGPKLNIAEDVTALIGALAIGWKSLTVGGQPASERVHGCALRRSVGVCRKCACSWQKV